MAPARSPSSRASSQIAAASGERGGCATMPAAPAACRCQALAHGVTAQPAGASSTRAGRPATAATAEGPCRGRRGAHGRQISSARIQVRDGRQLRPGRLDHHAAVVERRGDAGDVAGRQHRPGGTCGGGQPRGRDAVEAGRVHEHVDAVAPRPGGGDLQLPLARRDDDQVIDQVPGEREQPPTREPCPRQAGKRIADGDARLVGHRRAGRSLRCGSRRASSQSSSPQRLGCSPRPGERPFGA